MHFNLMLALQLSLYRSFRSGCFSFDFCVSPELNLTISITNIPSIAVSASVLSMTVATAEADRVVLAGPGSIESDGL